MSGYIQRKLQSLERRTRGLRALMSRRHLVGLLGVLIIVVGVFGVSGEARAEGWLDVSGGIMNAYTWVVLYFTELAMAMVTFFLRFLIELAGYNGFIDAPPVEIGWFMVRDVANMFFIIMLLVIAFGTILGIEQYEWKKTLGKLLMAAILINFSKLILQLMIDIAHVFTTTFLNAIAATSGGNLIRMFKLDNITSIVSYEGGGGKQTEALRKQILIGSTMALLMAILAMVTIGAYLVIMLVRVMVLWFLIAFSPFAFLMQAIPATKSYADEFWKEFTNHVIVAPIMVFFLWLSFATIGSGNIASEVGLQLSKVGESGASASVGTSLSSNPSVTASEGSTWDNLASFVIAISFLWIGAMAVQRLGVKGGEAVGKGLEIGKKIARHATGLSLAQRKYEDVKETATDYGKIIAGKTGVAKFFGKNRASYIKRKAAVEKEEGYYKERAAEISELTSQGKGGIAGKFVTQGDKRLKQKIRTAAVKKKGDEETKKREEELKGEYHSKIRKDIKEEEDRRKAVAAAGGREFVPLSNEDKGRIAAKHGLGLLEVTIATQEAKDAENVAKSIELDIQVKEMLTQSEVAEERSKKLIDELAVDKSFDDDLEAEKARINVDASIRPSAKAAAKATATADTERKKRDNTERASKKAGIASMDPDDYTKLIASISDKDKAKAERKAFEGLSRFESIAKEKGMGVKESKLKSETERVSATVGDVLRAEQNKGRKLVREREELKAREEMKEMTDSLDGAQVLSQFAEKHKILRDLSTIPSTNLTPEQKDLLKNTTQEQMLLVGSALHRGLGSELAKSIVANDSSYAGEDLSSAEGVHRLFLAGTSGRSFGEIDDIDKASAVEREISTNAREKASIGFRVAKLGATEAASKHGQKQFTSLFQEGIDSRGMKVVGLSANMVAGVGRGNSLGTGNIGETGVQSRDNYITGVIDPSFTINSSSDRRTYLSSTIDASSGKEVFTGAAGATEKSAILSIADQSADQITKLSGSFINTISGGDGKESGYSSTTGTFSGGHGGQRALFKEVLEKFKANIRNTTSASGKDRHRQSMKKFLNLLGVDDANIEFNTTSGSLATIETLDVGALVN
jgi:hypothetical protein